eukprot:333065_1
MVSLSRTNITIVLVTICLITIFPTNVNTSPTIIDGKYSLDNFMNPIQDKEQCNNYYTNNQHVCDPNNYITYPDKKKLGDIMHKSENNPIIACPFGNDGIQFGILIISSFNDYHSTKINKGFSISETSKFYAKLYHEKWEIGNDKCNNGILIFLNVADKYLHISTSTFLRTNYISDDFINNNIMPQIRPYLKTNQYTDGIIKIIELITDKCQIQLIDKITEREKNTFDNINKNSTQHTITRNYEIWIFMTIVIGILFLMWLIWYTKCCCCGECGENNNTYRRHNRNNNRYQDEGVPFNQPGMAQRQPQNNNVHRMSSNLRSRNVSGTYSQKRFRNDNNERLKKEREEKLKLEQQSKNNEKIVNNGKRINNGGGVGMSWNNGGNPNAPIETNDGSDCNEQVKLKNEKIVKEGKRIKNGGGGGMSWNDKNNNGPNEEPVVYKRTKDGGGGGGSW